MNIIKIQLKSLFFIATLFLWSLVSKSQIQKIGEAKKLFPDANVVCLFESATYRVSIENGKIKATGHFNEQLYINKEAGISYQKKSISSNDYTEAVNIKAFTLVPKANNRFDKKDVEKIDLKSDVSDNVFYDDNKIYEFDYPSAQPGAILNLNYQINYIEPRFMGRFFAIDIMPKLENELVIIVQKNINIKFSLYNCDSSNIEFTQTQKKDEIVYKWTMKNQKPMKYYSNSPNIKYFEPTINFHVTNYTIDGITKTLLDTPKDLFNWYNSMHKNVNKTESSMLKEITLDLVEGSTTEIEKVKKIFYWVQDNISYVAFEDGFGGFVPRDAGLVCSRKYGDCKDMASIIQEMFRIAGINCYLTIIGSRDIPYTFEQESTPLISNHMIAVYKNPSGKWIFLDGTGDNAPLEVFTSFIQGKEAMISISPDSFIIEKLPVLDTNISQTIDSVDIQLAGKEIQGKGKMAFTGYNRLDYIYATKYFSKDEQLNYFKERYSKGNNKTNFTNLSSFEKSRESHLKINYDFISYDYAKVVQNEIYLNLNIANEIKTKIEADRKAPLDFDHKTKQTTIITFKIPQGYKIDYLPQNSSFKNHIAGFSNSYIQKNGSIVLSSVFYINSILIQIKDFELYNKVLSEQLKAFKQSLTLIKI